MKTRRSWVTCWWTARQLQRYLDADPSAVLGHERINLIEQHLATCARCTVLTSEYQRLLALLHELGAARMPDERLVSRLQEHLALILDRERP